MSNGISLNGAGHMCPRTEARLEGEVLAERAAVLGIPQTPMLVINQVTHTAEEARAVAWPLQWIPPLRDATPLAWQKFRISPERTMRIWDPEVCEINGILHIAAYLQPDSRSKR